MSAPETETEPAWKRQLETVGRYLIRGLVTLDDLTGVMQPHIEAAEERGRQEAQAELTRLRAANAMGHRVCPECDEEQTTCTLCGASLEA